ncbi:MAG: hypothetical protein KAJ23_18550 [Maribacter sp.]|nr:hypothetical protein [Maribacter sp.]
MPATEVSLSTTGFMVKFMILFMFDIYLFFHVSGRGLQEFKKLVELGQYDDFRPPIFGPAFYGFIGDLGKVFRTAACGHPGRLYPGLFRIKRKMEVPRFTLRS